MLNDYQRFLLYREVCNSLYLHDTGHKLEIDKFVNPINPKIMQAKRMKPIHGAGNKKFINSDELQEQQDTFEVFGRMQKQFNQTIRISNKLKSVIVPKIICFE